MFNLNSIDPSWQAIIKKALSMMDQDYLRKLQIDDSWLPGRNKVFNAFTLPLNDVKYILLGESPYPRNNSANGYAFWDAAVNELWISTGMSKAVNRATSLRNFLKMLMVANHSLNVDQTSQEAIALIDKAGWIKSLDELFSKLLKHGFLLLNASLVFRSGLVAKDRQYWQPFIASLLSQLSIKKKPIYMILLGNNAKKLMPLCEQLNFTSLMAEHPYNTSFISNENILSFFKPFKLLKKCGKMCN